MRYVSILFATFIMKINSVAYQDNIYLRCLDNIANKPKTLYIIGELPNERLKTVAIVGSRKPSAYGKELTYRIAYDLAKRGLVIISGLALGIDAIAHQAALDAKGKTIAVLASGLDNITPMTNRCLAEDILKNGGAIISEYPSGTSIKSYQFLARNRLVSGISDFVLVTEATSRSGTLSTVAHALDQGKEVGAIPGPVTSPLSAGCHKIIQQGAHLITSASDILSILSLEDEAPNQQIDLLGFTHLEVEIIKLIESGVRDGEQLKKMTKASSSEFFRSLSVLEIQGLIKSLGANQWTKK